MSGTSDKAAGVANETIGKAKQGIGNAVGSDKMKNEGAAQEVKGDAQRAVGDAKNATKEAVDKTAGRRVEKTPLNSGTRLRPDRPRAGCVSLIPFLGGSLSRGNLAQGRKIRRLVHRTHRYSFTSHRSPRGRRGTAL